jgi:hypothetical protein
MLFLEYKPNNNRIVEIMLRKYSDLVSFHRDVNIVKKPKLKTRAKETVNTEERLTTNHGALTMMEIAENEANRNNGKFVLRRKTFSRKVIVRLDDDNEEV